MRIGIVYNQIQSRNSKAEDDEDDKEISEVMFHSPNRRTIYGGFQPPSWLAKNNKKLLKPLRIVFTYPFHYKIAVR